MAGEPVLQRPKRLRNTLGLSAGSGVMDQANNESHDTSSTTPRARPVDDDPDQGSSSPPTISTPSKSKPKNKSTTTSTPKSKKRKSRPKGYADDSDSDYRAPSTTTSRKTSRRASFETDPDGDYGGSMTPTRKMTRPILSRYSYRKLISEANDSGDEDDEDEREGLCLASCPFYETAEMLECEGVECGGRRFHPGCVGFRVKPVLWEGRGWFCFECRRVEGRGLRTNGVFVEGEEEGEVGEVV
ncbi:hypothetical protein M409DRAFT_51418 [Zasmidium cellare ATCC 36951]|uniref:PHD-type domain-containing protein n=1 Tax=Zasmidium cellare ATCC 36951 TaxID=1080233 RepID=A0A6A6CVY5_ZASCE|nr:uncharacterized protein M409DRAFT_51418 [Zasmidium cellare ATCC 36951]KAF2170368.1 hypothetical protein M409DRAFT_51418 [Zasmidium cellare ATCC 36951]